MSHKGQTLIRKLRQKIKVENEDSVKLEEVAEPANEDFESKQHPNDNERKYLQSDDKETKPIQNDAPAGTFVAEKIVPTEKISGDEEDTEVQKQSPIIVLLEDKKNACLRRIKSLLFMKLGFVLKRNFIASRMR